MFQPSDESYGNASAGRYAAQQALTTYRTGQDVGDSLGFFSFFSPKERTSQELVDAREAGDTSVTDEMIYEASRREIGSAVKDAEKTTKTASKSSSSSGGGSGFGLAAIGGAITGLVAGVAGPIVGAVHEGKQNKLNREHEKEMAKEQKKLLQEQTKLMNAQAQMEANRAQASGASVAAASWIGGAIILVGLGSVAAYMATNRKPRKSKKTKSAE